MSKRHDYDVSYGLEKALSQSIERVRENIERNHKIRREIVKLRQQRRQMERVPEDVRRWFAETAPYLENEADEGGAEE